MWICAAALLVIVVRSAAALGASPRRLLAIAVAVGLFPLALGSVVLTATTSGRRRCRRRARRGPAGRERLGLAVLGIAVAAKIYPLVLLPLPSTSPAGTGDGRPRSALAPSLRRWQWWSSCSCSSPPTACGTRLAPARPAAADREPRRLPAPRRPSARLLRADGRLDARLAEPLRSVPDALATVQTVLQAAALVAVWALFARGSRRPGGSWPPAPGRWLSSSPSGRCSPQFLIWLVPVVPLVAGRVGSPRCGVPRSRPHLDAPLVPDSLLGHGRPAAGRLARPRPQRPPRRSGGRARRGYGTGTRTGSQPVARPSARTPRAGPRCARRRRPGESGPVCRCASAGSRARRGRRSPSRADRSCPRP